MKFLLFILLISVIPNISLAQNLGPYQNRFEIQVNEDGERLIVDKTILENVSIETYIKNLAKYLKPDDLNMAFNIPSCKGVSYEKPDLKLMKNFEKAFDWMKQSNLGQLLEDEKFLQFLKEVEKLGKAFTDDPSYAVMANLDNPTYFYKQQFMKYVQKQIKKLVKSQIELAPYLKVISYIADDYTNMIALKKTYHQNILAYYLETAIPEDLNLSESDRARALSSIAESRLSFGFSGQYKSSKIKKNFETYGLDLLKKVDNDGEKRWNKFSTLFDLRLYKLTASFSEVSFEGNPIYINVSVKKDKLINEPSFVFDNECPDFVYQIRKNYEFIRVALGMSPIPYSSKLFTLIKAKYQPQALNEGAFVGFLESTNQDTQKKNILKQSMNPLL